MRPAALAMLLGACAPALPERLDDGLTAVTVARACPEGFAPSDGACDAVLPPGECPAGTMPLLGSTSCAPVGHHGCGAGFTADPSGWGCTEVLPAARCAGATREALGATDCQPVGDCAAPFPPPGAAVFVDDDGPTDATHFKTIAAALQVTPVGGVVAVEAGTYVESLRLNRNVTLWGRCAAQVRLQAAAGAGVTGLEVSAAATVRGLTVTGHFNGALLRSTGALTVEQCVFEANQISGINASGALTVTDSVVRDGVPDGTGDWGTGLYLQNGGSSTVRRTAVIANARAGIVAQDPGTTLTLEDSVLKDTRPRGDGTNGIGLVIAVGASAAVRRSAVVANAEAGIAVEGEPGENTRAVVEGCVVRDTRPLPNPIVDPLDPLHREYHGMNVEVQGSATLELRASTLARSGGNNLLVVVAPAAATVSDVTVYETRPFPDGYGTAALVAQAGSTLEVTRSAFVRGSAVGAQIYGATARFVDSLVAQTQSVTPRMGDGVLVSDDASVTLTRCALTANEGAGLSMARLATLPPGRATVSQSVLAFGAGHADGTFGRGADLFDGAILEMDLSAVVHNREVGLVVEASSARVTRSVLADTRADGAGKMGRGLNVQGGGRADVLESLLEGNRDVAVMVGQGGSQAVLTDTVVRDTRSRDADGKFGIAVCALQGGRVDLTRTLLRSSAFIGLAAGGAAATLAGSLLSHNPVALQVQDGSTLAEVDSLPASVGAKDVLVTRDTRFDANVVKLGSGAVPLPGEL